MKKIFIATAIVSFLLTLILCLAFQAPVKKYNVQVSLDDANGLINVINQSDAPNVQRKYYIELITGQINAQIADSTKKK